ncbi:MAG: hypothetical protein HY941_06610 [Gammaproteobacteria bacterium]|nr:hypothetical protein [Gammaproteobacteria bacterium]
MSKNHCDLLRACVERSRNPGLTYQAPMGKSRIGEFFFDHGFEQCSAIRDLAGAGMGATELEIPYDIVFDIQQADQCDFLFFTVRAGLSQQCNRIAPFDEPFASIKADSVEIVISQASWVMARHGITPLHTANLGINVLLLSLIYYTNAITRGWERFTGYAADNHSLA